MTETITLSIDAMGGDIGPASTIAGAAKALSQKPYLRFMIYGDELRIYPVLNKYAALKKASTVYHTPDFIRNDEKPSMALRTGKKSSMGLAIQAVQTKEAQAVISSGNTGALMALSKMTLKTMSGIRRPAIASIMPTVRGKTVMLDLGANVLVDAENLVEFAVMGSVFAKAMNNIATPSVGLLNVGSEATKGPDHVRNAAKILNEIEFPGRYHGFVEGNDIGLGTTDVIVCDGYAGNIALKTMEGAGKLTSHYYKTVVMKDPLGLIGSLISYFTLKRFKNKLDPRRYNGGVFLGLNGLCVKSHGGSDALAFSTAILMAAGLAEKGYLNTVSKDISHLMTEESFVA